MSWLKCKLKSKIIDVINWLKYKLKLNTKETEGKIVMTFEELKENLLFDCIHISNINNNVCVFLYVFQYDERINGKNMYLILH